MSNSGLERAKPAQIRQGLQAAQTLARHGVEFICIPVVNGNRLELMDQFNKAMEALEKQAGENEQC